MPILGVHKCITKNTHFRDIFIFELSLVIWGSECDVTCVRPLDEVLSFSVRGQKLKKCPTFQLGRLFR